MAKVRLRFDDYLRSGAAPAQTAPAAIDSRGPQNQDPPLEPKPRYIKHRVQADDTISKLCLLYDTSESVLKRLNGFTKVRLLLCGLLCISGHAHAV